MVQHCVKAIPAFQDNYIWAIHNPEETEIIVVDPGDAKPVLAYLQQHRLQLKAILLTHHHWDHSGGISDLLTHFPSVPVYGPAKERVPVPGVNHPMQEGDVIDFRSFGLSFTVLDIPGHTLGHIAFFGNGMLFCGDTLFSCGCGRVFEGTPEQMVASLQKLQQLPDKTRVYCGHEYTLANIRFAKTLEPHNEALIRHELKSLTLSEKNIPTLPSTLAEEKAMNPFLRCAENTIIDAVLRITNNKNTDIVSIFVQVRELKNTFAR